MGPRCRVTAYVLCSRACPSPWQTAFPRPGPGTKTKPTVRASERHRQTGCCAWPQAGPGAWPGYLCGQCCVGGCRLVAEDKAPCSSLLFPPRGLLLAAFAAVWLPLVYKRRIALGQRTRLLRLWGFSPLLARRPQAAIQTLPPKAGRRCTYLFPRADRPHSAHSPGPAIRPLVPQMACETRGSGGSQEESRSDLMSPAARSPAPLIR